MASISQIRRLRLLPPMPGGEGRGRGFEQRARLTVVATLAARRQAWQPVGALQANTRTFYLSASTTRDAWFPNLQPADIL